MNRERPLTSQQEHGCLGLGWPTQGVWPAWTYIIAIVGSYLNRCNQRRPEVIDWRIDTRRGMLLVKCVERVAVDDITWVLAEIQRHPDWRTDLHVVVDFSAEVAIGDFDPLSIRRLQVIVEAFAARKTGGKWAVIASDAVARVLLRFVLTSFDLPSVSCEVFLDRIEALNWVGA